MVKADPIPAEVRERIHRVASELYAKSAYQSLPALDEVRKCANVDMNVASLVLKEWRKIQPVSPEPLASKLPAPVEEAGLAAVVAIWQHAQQFANQHLRTAQAGWQTEREELDALRAELAEAFERQAAELEATSQQLSMVLALNTRQQQELERAAPRLDESASRLGETETRLVMVERELGETHEKLAQSYDDVRALRQQCDELRKECDSLRKQQAELQEELRVQRSDKESAHRAVASLRQQLQAASGGKAADPVSAPEAVQDQKESNESEAVAYGQSVSGRLATSSRAADLIVRSR
ncbi:KfrA protein [Aquitalea magnusonii]|uniref:KfrA protein n=1 Tax=Aquitalea magnusonii TaxID=332411 RepID=A0A3G9GHU2_9NEIS|nr:DNA-binding protein [Aquitalea magnusonii]BBF86934.1 KfrA protein [Aquitalea magnusonii]